MTFDVTTMNRLLFANITIQHMRESGGFEGLLGPLDQWKTAIDQIAFTSSPLSSPSSTSTASEYSVNITRLDCAWPNCFGPRLGTGAVTLIDGGDFCAPYDTQNVFPSVPRHTRLNESYILVSPLLSHLPSSHIYPYLAVSTTTRLRNLNTSSISSYFYPLYQSCQSCGANPNPNPIPIPIPTLL